MSGRRISRIQQLISFYEGSREDEDEDDDHSSHDGEDIIDAKGTVIPWLENHQTCQDGKVKPKHFNAKAYIEIHFML